MSAITLALGLLLPWAVGIALVFAARDRAVSLEAPGEVAWLVGAGYPAGALVLTLSMRALALAGVRFNALSVVLPLVAATAGLVIVGWRRHGLSRFDALALRRALGPPPDIGGKIRVAWYVLAAAIALHLLLAGYEIALRPLYPWEAWIAWATKARVWFDQGTIVPFADARSWLAAKRGLWFDASPLNPPALPLLQVYACIMLGRWDDALMNWPWWQFGTALVFAVYGGLRRVGIGALAALVATYFVASLPLANVHVALAGYAELPLAACYTTSVLAFLRFAHDRTWRDAVIAVLFAAAGMLVNTTGVFYALTLLPGFVVVTMPRRGGPVLVAAFGLIVLAIAVLAQTDLAWQGRSLRLEFAPDWTLLAQSLFIAGNWNLLWYGVFGVALLARRQLTSPTLMPFAGVLAAGLLFLGILFAFPALRAAVSNQPTVDRAMLPLAPAFCVFIVVAFREFAAGWRAAREQSVATAKAVSVASHAAMR